MPRDMFYVQTEVCDAGGLNSTMNRLLGKSPSGFSGYVKIFAVVPTALNPKTGIVTQYKIFWDWVMRS